MRTAALLVLAVAPCSVYGDVEFNGLMADADSSQFLLRDTATETSSGWLRLGDPFDGCVLVAYHRETGVLDVTAEGATKPLVLKEAKVAAPAEEKPPAKEWARRRAHVIRYGSLGELICAQVTSDSRFVYITPREVGKETGFAAGSTVAVPIGPASAFPRALAGLWIMAVKPETKFTPGSTMMMAGTNGVTAAGNTPMQDFRDYYAQDTSGSPPGYSAAEQPVK